MRRRWYSVWNETRVIVDRKSKFQGRHVPLEDPLAVPGILQDFLRSHKRLAKTASHPLIYAWRTASTKGSELVDVQQGYNDCGEKGAGARLLAMLQQQNVVNKLVIVTRWYGGTPLGPLRFRHVLQCAYETLRGEKS